MIRITTLSLALGLVGGSALAEAHTMNTDNLIRSRDITGGEVYTTANPMNDADWDAMQLDGVGSDWNDIGEIEDIVLDQNGQMIGIVAEVGGFLDIGDKHVMLPIEDVKLTAVDDGSYAVVTRKSEEELEEMQGVDESFME